MSYRYVKLDPELDGVITRSKLEYPTEDVTFAYLTVIDKTKNIRHRTDETACHTVTIDEFADKAIEGWGTDDVGLLVGRQVDEVNFYCAQLVSAASTADYRIVKIENDTATILGEESVDLGSGCCYPIKFSCSGSTLKAYRVDMTTAKISVTDTTFASGVWGPRTIAEGRPSIGFPIYLRAPSSPAPKPKTVIETEIIGSGTEEDPFRPNLKQELSKHDKFGNIDKLSVTWGAFDHKPEHNTMLICITGGNQYTGDKAILEQIEHAKRKNLKVVKPPKDYHEACEQYRKLKKEFPEWIAGKDNFAYMTLGHEDFEAMQVADTYHGNIVDGIKPNAYKNVPEFEMRRTLNMWKERLKRAKVMKSEAKKHIEKIEKVEKIGW